jgi:hypothetical protein
MRKLNRNLSHNTSKKRLVARVKDQQKNDHLLFKNKEIWQRKTTLKSGKFITKEWIEMAHITGLPYT